MDRKEAIDKILRYINDGVNSTEDAKEFLTLWKYLGIENLEKDAKDILIKDGRSFDIKLNGTNITVSFSADESLNEEYFEMMYPDLYRKILEEKKAKVRVTLSDVKSIKDDDGFKMKLGKEFINYTANKGTVRVLLPKKKKGDEEE